MVVGPQGQSQLAAVDLLTLAVGETIIASSGGEQVQFVDREETVQPNIH